jgi:hypothetical protein
MSSHTSPTPFARLRHLVDEGTRSEAGTPLAGSSRRTSAHADDATLAHEPIGMEEASKRQPGPSDVESKTPEDHEAQFAPLKSDTPPRGPDDMFEREKEGLETVGPLPPSNSDGDFPDGGLRAWSVVIGVSFTGSLEYTRN